VLRAFRAVFLGLRLLGQQPRVGLDPDLAQLSAHPLSGGCGCG
jgi:hypothetical protein